MRILQVNSSVNTGSTGRIAEDIGNTLLQAGHDSWIAYGRPVRKSLSSTIRIGGPVGQFLHGIQTRLLDNHGFGSKWDTRRFVREAGSLRPDVIHLHNLHGYYINVEVLFEWIRNASLPVVWTMHDCWSFTGHCTQFDSVQCEKWQSLCHHCPKISAYPASYFADNSIVNYNRKKLYFGAASRLHIVTPSKWLANHLGRSFLKHHPVSIIHNGVDTGIFHPSASSGFRGQFDWQDKKIILGVANIWGKSKGLEDFLKLSTFLPHDTKIVLVGLEKKQQKGLPDNIIGLSRTESQQQLAGLYATADVFVNPTWQDTFPTTNLESLASGTPVITYDTGGSPEAVDNATGIVVSKGDIAGLFSAITAITGEGKSKWSAACRQRALQLFNRVDRYADYLRLYETILTATPASK